MYEQRIHVDYPLLQKEEAYKKNNPENLSGLTEAVSKGSLSYFFLVFSSSSKLDFRNWTFETAS